MYSSRQLVRTDEACQVRGETSPKTSIISGPLGERSHELLMLKMINLFIYSTFQGYSEPRGYPGNTGGQGKQMVCNFIHHTVSYYTHTHTPVHTKTQFE